MLVNFTKLHSALSYSKEQYRFTTNLRRKLLYLQRWSHANATTDGASRRCIAVFETLFTISVWVPIPCDDVLSNIFFICEYYIDNQNSELVNQKTYETTCPEHFTYVGGYCFMIALGQPITQLSDMYAFNFQALSAMLTQCSLGTTWRHAINLYINQTETLSTGLHTEAFPHQRIKSWNTFRATLHNKHQVYNLLKRDPYTYKNPCRSGQHFTCRHCASIMA